jgi:hypothetical protein
VTYRYEPIIDDDGKMLLNELILVFRLKAFNAGILTDRQVNRIRVAVPQDVQQRARIMLESPGRRHAASHGSDKGASKPARSMSARPVERDAGSPSIAAAAAATPPPTPVPSPSAGASLVAKQSPIAARPVVARARKVKGCKK